MAFFYQRTAYNIGIVMVSNTALFVKQWIRDERARVGMRPLAEAGQEAPVPAHRYRRDRNSSHRRRASGRAAQEGIVNTDYKRRLGEMEEI
jgi:hypothetical protein